MRNPNPLRRLPRSVRARPRRSPSLPPRPAAVRRMSQLTLSDGVLSGLSTRADIIKEFPFMRLPRIASRRGCRCGAPSADRVKLSAEMNRVRLAVRGLPADRLQRLKRMVGANVLALFINEGGRVVKHSI